MKNTRLLATGIIVALAAAVGMLYGAWSSQPSLATIRSNIANSGKLACFSNARADVRNAQVADARLTAFCTCTLDQTVAAMTDGDVRAASANEQVVSDAMRVKLVAASAACRPLLQG